MNKSNESFEFLLNHSISTNIYLMLLMIITVVLIMLLVFISAYSYDVTNSTIYRNPKSKKIYALTPITIICCLTIFLTWLVYLTNSNRNYITYLESQLTSQTYKVKEIKSDNYVITSDNEKIKNESTKTQIVTTPTTDKTKVGKNYYTIKVYKPEKVKKLLGSNNPITRKYKNRLVQHVYVSEKE